MATPRWHRPRILLRTLACVLLLVSCVQCRDTVISELVPNTTKDSFSELFSIRDSYFNASDLSKCFSLNVVNCLKVSLLQKVNRLLALTKTRQLERTTELMGGLVTLETSEAKNGVDEEVDDEVDDERWDVQEYLDAGKERRLNALLVARLERFFRSKALLLKFIPGLTVRVFPAKTVAEYVRISVQLSGENLQQVMSRTMKMGGMMRSPWMLIGPMITLGMFPFMLANLKYMVMNAFMINNMALMMALRTTITNMVFGDGEGDNIVYRNKGYSNEYKNKPIDDHYPNHAVRYTVKPYNQINKYRKVYTPHAPPKPHPVPHFQDGGDHLAAGSQHSFAVSAKESRKNSTNDDATVKYIAHHDYFGQRRPMSSVMNRFKAPMSEHVPVKYVEHHDYFGGSNQRPQMTVVERLKAPVTAAHVKYVAHHGYFGGEGEADRQRNTYLTRPPVVADFSPSMEGKFGSGQDNFPGRVQQHIVKDVPVTTMSVQNNHFPPTNQVNSFFINANGQDNLNTVKHHKGQIQDDSNEVPSNHKANDEIVKNHNSFGIQSRVDNPESNGTQNGVANKTEHLFKITVQDASGEAQNSDSLASKSPITEPQLKTPSPVNTIIDRDQNSWIAKGETVNWPIIYQDPTTIHQEPKLRSTEVGTVFPVFPGTVLNEPEALPEAKHSVQVTSGIRFEDSASAAAANSVAEVGGYFGDGEVINVSPHGDDPAIIFHDSMDLSDENEFVNFPQRLVQTRIASGFDRKSGVAAADDGAKNPVNGERVVSRLASRSHQQRNPVSHPEPLWVFRE